MKWIVLFLLCTANAAAGYSVYRSYVPNVDRLNEAAYGLHYGHGVILMEIDKLEKVCRNSY